MERCRWYGFKRLNKPAEIPQLVSGSLEIQNLAGMLGDQIRAHGVLRPITTWLLGLSSHFTSTQRWVFIQASEWVPQK